MELSFNYCAIRFKAVIFFFCIGKVILMKFVGQVQRKVIERGEISVEDEIADSVFMKVSEVYPVVRSDV